jgi:hypothetical protein
MIPRGRAGRRTRGFENGMTGPRGAKAPGTGRAGKTARWRGR